MNGADEQHRNSGLATGQTRDQRSDGPQSDDNREVRSFTLSHGTGMVVTGLATNLPECYDTLAMVV
jgi:hypothetical protein